jgi:hypothetical protein
MAPALLEAPGRGQAGHVVALLGGDRHPEQRASGAVLAPLAVERAGALAGALEVAHDDRVERLVQPLDALDVVVEQFEAADAAAADEGGEAAGRQEGEIRHRLTPSSS